MKVLHLVGSNTSEYYYNVSVMYAKGFVSAFPELTNVILLGHLDGKWSLPSTLNEADMEVSEKMSLTEVLVRLEANKLDIMQPHMFCYSGMATYRSIASLLDIPILGNASNVMALTTNKWQSRAVVSSVGVPVPKAILVEPGERERLLEEMNLPFLLKPAREDNSMGITLVQEAAQLDEALATAFAFDSLVLAEEFIPLGREIRIGVVERDDGTLEFLPSMEYFLDKKKLPIRTSLDKLTPGKNEDGTKETLDFAPVDRECPALIDDALEKKLYDIAVRAHRALECQHYSLYDVRIDPEGSPYFIEASPYCSFSPKSAIVTMSCGGNKYNHKDLFYRLAKKAISDYMPVLPQGDLLDDSNRHEKTSKQKLGMRRRNSPTSVRISGSE